jgi:hypothetical protein
VADITGLLRQIVSGLGDVLTIVGVINSNTKSAAQEYHPYDINNITGQIYNIVADGTYGNAALRDDLDALIGTVLTSLDNITDILTTIQADGVPAILPGTPPPGYGGGDPTGTADAVWGYIMPIVGNTTLDELQNAGRFSVNASISGVMLRAGDNPYILYKRAIWYDARLSPPSSQPTFDWNAIFGWDSLLHFLNGTTGWTWVLDPNGSGLYTTDADDGLGGQFICTLTEAQFRWEQQFVSVNQGGASVRWPGLAQVTLGDPVPLDIGVTVDGPMNGVIIDLSSVPSSLPAYSFDGDLSYRYAGALAFVSDNGQEEEWQRLGFTSQVYVPLAMISATAVKIRTAGGIVGTATPWVVIT